jgi:hypothetical protein
MMIPQYSSKSKNSLLNVAFHFFLLSLQHQCHFLDHGDMDELIPDQLRVLDPKVNQPVPYQVNSTTTEA